MSATTALVAAGPAAVAALGGAAAGSVAGAALTRWPRGLTLGRPSRSRCDRCDRDLTARDLVPVVSWVWLGGRCRSCGLAIDARLPMLEAAAAGLAVCMVAVHGLTVDAALLALGAVAVLTASIVDLDRRIVPDRLTRPLMVVALGALALRGLPGPALVGALAWAVGVPALLRIAALVADHRRRARPVGAGDIKLLVGVLALVAPDRHAPAALLLLAVILGGVVALIGLVTGRLDPRSRLPFAPAIGAAYLLVVLAPSWSVTALTTIGGHA